jgi:hypothetical protein
MVSAVMPSGDPRLHAAMVQSGYSSPFPALNQGAALHSNNTSSGAVVPDWGRMDAGSIADHGYGVYPEMP